LIIPLTSGGQVNGQLSFRFTEERDFDPEELEIARALAIPASLGDREKTGAIPTSHRMSPASLVAEATASRAIPRSKHGFDLA
jgi:hypothetical protein